MTKLTFCPHPGAIQVRRSFSSINSRQESSQHIIKSSKISCVADAGDLCFLGNDGGSSKAFDGADVLPVFGAEMMAAAAMVGSEIEGGSSRPAL